MAVMWEKGDVCGLLEDMLMSWKVCYVWLDVKEYELLLLKI